MYFENNSTLRSWLVQGGYSHLAEYPGFDFDVEAFHTYRTEVEKQWPEHSEIELQSRAAYRILTHVTPETTPKLIPSRWQRVKAQLVRVPWNVVWKLAMLLLLAAVVAKAQQPVNIVTFGGIQPSMTGNNLNVQCANCSGSGVSAVDNSAFTVGTGNIVPIGGYYTSGADPTLATGNVGRARIDSHSYLLTDCAVGCSGGATTPADAFANPTTASLNFDFLAGWNGATWDRLQVDGSKFLKINCAVGCSGGATTPTDAFANPTTASLNMGFNMGWNGATWDRLQVDASKFLKVTIAAQSLSKLLVTADPITFASAQAVTQSGNWTARIVGNAGGVVDAAGQNAAFPANWLGAGCEFTTSPTTITTTNGSPLACDNANNLLVNLKTAIPAGANTIGAVTQASGPWTINHTQTAGSTLGALANYGTSPGAVLVESVNAFITNTVPVTLTSTTITGTVAVTESGTWSNRVVGNAGAAFDAATGAAPPANVIYVGGLGSGATGGDLLGIPVSDTYKNINISTATTTLLITGVSGRQVRIGALHLMAAGADNVELIEGTGATCGTGTAGMAGGTTSGLGYVLLANQGLTIGSGVGTVIQTATAGDSVCAVTSAAVQLSGGAEYSIY